jgi:hypothetical protein
MTTINYTPDPVAKQFIKDYQPGKLFANWIVGPYGSGKTTAIFFKLIRMAALQTPSPDGVRRVRAVVVRNTMPQLIDTTISSWFYWFKDGEAGKWEATNKKFTLRFGDVSCEVLFRALDTEDDIARVLSLETTFVLVDEFVQIPKKIIEALEARCGRYPSAKDGGATNWGMWGSSNTDTEDSWWFEALGNARPYTEDAQAFQGRMNEMIIQTGKTDLNPNWTYYHQPSGFDANAENIKYLPGGAAYYENMAKGKSDAWINQYINAEWGYTTAGLPVITTFRPEIHVAKGPIAYRPGLKLIAGYDPGMSSAMIFMQCDKFGRLSVLEELVTRDYGTVRLITDRVKPLLKTRFPNADFVISPDPAANQRAQKDERTVVDEIKKHYKVKIPTDNNQLPGRISAIEHYTTRLTENGAALQIDPSCKQLIRALRAGWRYNIPAKGEAKEVPLKNWASHVADAFSYGCQFFYIEDDRTAKAKKRGNLPTFRNPYVIR